MKPKTFSHIPSGHSVLNPNLEFGYVHAWQGTLIINSKHFIETIRACIYLLHLFTEGKPKQLTLVFIVALHSFHIVTNMYVQNIVIQYSQIART